MSRVGRASFLAKSAQDKMSDEFLDFEEVLHAAPVGLAILDAELRYVYCNDLLAEINGVAAQEHLGRTVAEVVPEVAPEVERPFRMVFETEQPIYGLKIRGSTPKEPEIQRAWLESIQPLRSRDGAVGHILVSVQEITALERAEAALRENERVLRASHQLSPQGFTILRAIRNQNGECIDFAWQYANPAAEAALKAGPLVGKRLLEVLPGNREHPDLFPRYVRVLSKLEPDEVELYYDFDGISGWFRNCAVAIDLDRLAVSFEDISRRKVAEERLALVTAEFRHRIKNTLAVVDGILALTAKYATDVPNFAKGVRARLRALGAAQDLLKDTGEPSVSLDQVVHAALGPFEGKNLTCTLNAEASVASDAVVPLTLALNELATNAIKYGALSSAEGRAEMACEVNAGKVTLTWREIGGQMALMPSQRVGFGSRLIDEVARQLLAGRVTKDFSPEGLQVVLEFESASGGISGSKE
jgi:PAS domain S-box-containing protein